MVRFHSYTYIVQRVTWASRDPDSIAFQNRYFTTRSRRFRISKIWFKSQTRLHRTENNVFFKKNWGVSHHGHIMANFFHLGFVDPNVFFRRLIWMFSVGISGSNRWRYLPYIRPMFEAYVREYPNKIWPYMVQYLHFRILEFPLMFPKMVFFCFHCKPSSYWDTPIYGKSPHLKVGA